MCVTFNVIFDLLFMNITVYFNNKSFRMTVKINNITINNLLSTKLEPIQMIVTQFLPQSFLGRCHFAPQFSCALIQFS